MATLITLLSYGKGTWAKVYKICNNFEWNKIIIIGDSFSKDKFHLNKEYTFLNVDFRKNSRDIRDELIEKLKEQKQLLEIALNISSGSGDAHMAVISSLINLGVAIKFVDLDENENIIEI